MNKYNDKCSVDNCDRVVGRKGGNGWGGTTMADNVKIICSSCKGEMEYIRSGDTLILTDLFCDPCRDKQDTQAHENQWTALVQFVDRLNKQYLADHPEIVKKEGIA